MNFSSASRRSFSASANRAHSSECGRELHGKIGIVNPRNVDGKLLALGSTIEDLKLDPAATFEKWARGFDGKALGVVLHRQVR
jgi:hypothetical protein